MATLTLDRSHLTEEGLNQLAQNTNLTHLAFGSKSRVLHDILVQKLEQQLTIFEQNVDKAFLRGAEGQLLEFFGEVSGVEKPKAQKASVSAEEKNFNFFTLETNFGAINNDNDIVIPKGTKIFNSPESTEKINYILTQDLILPSDETRVFFSARSEVAGSEVNVGEHTLNFHNFTNYADVLNNTLFVTNSASVTYGRPELDDESYRFLIKQQPLSNAKANFTAIDTALKQIPGVADVKRILYRRGIGTSDWIVKAVTPTVPDSLLDLCQRAIDDIKSDGLDHRAVAPETVGLQLFFSVTYKERLEDKEKSKIKTTIRRNITNYVNGLEIGRKLVLDQLINQILSSSDKIESLGTFDKKFDKIVVFKHSVVTNSRIKKVLLSDYQTEEHERVIIEPNAETPISIFDNN